VPPFVRPLPEITPRMAPFWSAAKRGRFAIQRCSACGANYFPATDICSACLGSELVWVPASGRAEVYSFVVMHHVYDPAFGDRVPYVVVDVRLEEGPHVISRLEGVELDGVCIGMAVSVAFERASEELDLPYFERC